MQGRTQADGFTVIELLAVIVILALLIALMLPVLSGMRAAARRTQCQNNVKQVAVAVIAFEAAQQTFPPAAKYLPDPLQPQSTDRRGHSMYSFLLPHFEEKVVFDQLQFDLDWLDRATPNAQHRTNYELTHTIHFGGLLDCPAAPRTRRHKYTNGEVIDEANEINQTADYAPAWYLDARLTASQMSEVTLRLNRHGVLDAQPLWALVPQQIFDRVRGTPTRATDPRQNRRWWGILRRQVGSHPIIVRAAHVRDGLSQTFLLFEAAGRPDHFVGNQPVAAEIMGTNTQGLRWGSPDLALKLDEVCHQDQLINCHNWDSLFSFHHQGAMVAFADGGVQFLHEDVDPETFVAMYSMAGNDIVHEQGTR
ncbi:MAG: DUF1559 domain-containing protein [Planctomycetota bacterium]